MPRGNTDQTRVGAISTHSSHSHVSDLSAGNIANYVNQVPLRKLTNYRIRYLVVVGDGAWPANEDYIRAAKHNDEGDGVAYQSSRRLSLTLAGTFSLPSFFPRRKSVCTFCRPRPKSRLRGGQTSSASSLDLQ